MLKTLLFVVSSHLFFAFVDGQTFSVFSDPYFRGVRVDGSNKECFNLPGKIAGNVSSISTHGQCARLYDAADCGGKHIEILARSPVHFNLQYWGFDDKTMSIGPCVSSCDPSVTGNAPGADERVYLEIYDRSEYKGSYQDIAVEGCTLIPTKFRFQLKSVYTFGKCLQFYSNVNCQPHEPRVDTIEVRPGTPLHNDLFHWHFREARSVSHCSYKCNSDTSRPERKEVFPEGPSHVALFDAKNFTGNAIKLEALNCIDVKGDWEGVADSIRIGSNPCVSLFSRHACTGSTLNVTESVADLSAVAFDGAIRSLKSCVAKPVMIQ